MKKHLEELIENLSTQLKHQRELRDKIYPFSLDYETLNVLITRMEWEYKVFQDLLNKANDLKLCSCPVKEV